MFIFGCMYIVKIALTGGAHAQSLRVQYSVISFLHLEGQKQHYLRTCMHTDNPVPLRSKVST